MLLDGYLVVSPFPARTVLPEEGENDLSACGERFGWQIDVLKVPSTVVGVGVPTALPVVKTPVHHGWVHQQKAQDLSAWECARLVVKAPVEVLRRYISG